MKESGRRPQRISLERNNHPPAPPNLVFFVAFLKLKKNWKCLAAPSHLSYMDLLLLKGHLAHARQFLTAVIRKVEAKGHARLESRVALEEFFHLLGEPSSRPHHGERAHSLRGQAFLGSSARPQKRNEDCGL